jgi:outer membrane protein OmpA-like peptidoglycan-associated protein
MSRIILSVITALSLAVLAGCSVNPFSSNNNLTGTATGTLVGAGAGAGIAALAGASKAEILLAGIAGGALGYYVTSLPFTAGGVTHVGGKVYTLGDYATIEIPSESLFDVNTSDLLPEAPAILDSAVSVLNRFPNDNIMISGNTNGYYSSKFERKLSEDRARQVAAYLWAHGINNDNISNPNENYGGRELPNRYSRDLNYVGYGSHFPIANNITAAGIRQNSRIQITAYPQNAKLSMNKCSKKMTHYHHKAYEPPQSSGTTLSESSPITGDEYNDQNKTSSFGNMADAGTSSKGESWETYMNKHPTPDASLNPPPPAVGCSTRPRYKGE